MKKIVLTAAILLCGSVIWAANAQVYKLDNGQTVVIQEVHNNPIVNIDTWIKTGSIDENDTNNGVAHFLEHLFFKGTQKHQNGDFDRILESKGAINNAATSKDFTHYYITIPSKDFDLAMELHADMLLNPMIPRNELEKERKVVLEEINKDYNSPTKILYENLISMMYSSHPYKRRVIGKSEVIETITRDKILEFYNEHYFPSNMVTIVVGDVDTSHALEKIKQEFNSSYKKAQKNIYPKELPLTQQKKKTEYSDVQTGYLMIGFRSADITNKDLYALDVLATVLGGGRSSVLNQVLKEKKHIAFSISAGNSTFKDDGIFYISANFEPEKCEIVQNTIFDEIEKIQQNGVDEEQIRIAKNIIERDTYYSRESVSNISSEMGYIMALTNNMQFYDNYINNIKNITPTDVKKVAQKYLGINKSAVSIVLPKGSDVPVANIKNSPSGSFELVSTNEQTQKYKLSNGAQLLYTPNSSNDIIAISIFAKGGKLLETKSGTGLLTAAGMLKGTKNYSMVELSQFLEDNGIKISPSVSPDSFTVSVLTTKDEYDKTLEILNEIVNNATFDEAELIKIKSDELNKIKANKDIPMRVALEKCRELLFPNSPYSISANDVEKNLLSITKEDVVKYYNNIFKAQNIVVSINGNVDVDKTISKFNNIFAKDSKNSTFNYSSFSAKIPYINKPQTNIIKMPTTETAWIMLGWQIDKLDNLKDYAALQVIDSLLGNGMSSRLFIDLREKQGLAYQLGSGYSQRVLRGSFLLYIGTNPNTLEQAKNGLFAEINKLKTQYVSDKELKDAKDKLIGNYIIGMETNSDKASTIGAFETYGYGYEFTDKNIQLIKEVTDLDIIEAANKYFNDNYVLSIVTK